MSDRARQFLPFDALTGFKEEIKKQEEIIQPRKELCEDEQNYLSFMINNLKKGMNVDITYYEGDKYVNLFGNLERIDIFNRIMYVKNKCIKFDDISNILCKDVDLIIEI